MKTVAEKQQSFSHINQGVIVHWVSFTLPLHLSGQPAAKPFALLFPLRLPLQPTSKPSLRKIYKFSVSRNKKTALAQM